MDLLTFNKQQLCKKFCTFTTFSPFNQRGRCHDFHCSEREQSQTHGHRGGRFSDGVGIHIQV